MRHSLALVLLSLAVAACHTTTGIKQDLRYLGGVLGDLSTPTSHASGSLFVVDPKTYGRHVSFDGEAFITDSQEANVYVARSVRYGKRYWEVQLLCGPIIPGVSSDVKNALTWGGYNGSEGKTSHAGVYTWLAVAWPDPPSGSRTPTWERYLRSRSGGANPFGIPSSGDVFGFALDADARSLRTFWNGQEGPTLQLTFPPPYFANVGFQTGFEIPTGQPCDKAHASAKYLLRTDTTVHQPPRGYRPLGD